MSALRAVWSELIGLFIDDGRFAGAILLWLAAGWLVLPRLGGGALPPLLLFAGLLAILMESAVRRTRTR